MINLEKSFMSILKKWGYDVFIQRKKANGNYEDNLQQVTTRSVFPKGRFEAKSADEESEGIVVNSDVVYYFEASVNPGEGDRIYEMIPNVASKYTIYVIDTSAPIRGKGGKIVYWTVGATREKQV
jgi:hypothetical protein